MPWRSICLLSACRKEVKVVQSGQGADEVFGGYFWYPQMAGGEQRQSTWSDSAGTTSTAATRSSWRR